MSLSRGGAMNNSRSLVLCVMLASFLAAAEARAKLYFLPDYQNNNYSSRSDSAPSGGGDIGKVDCQTVYGLVSACVAPMVPDAEYTFGKTTCYRCKCPNTYKTSCSSGSHLAGEVCSAGGVNYYPRCDADTCPSGYVAGKTCSQGYNREVNGKAGSQDCARCVAKSCPSGYTAGLANCNSKSFPAGWTYASNGYAGDSICGKCTAKSCAAGYTAGISQCSNTSSWTYGSNGYSGDQVCGKCTAKPCDSGYTAGLENCNGKSHPAGWSFSTGVKSGNTTCGKCTAKTCAAGSTSCAAPTTPVANSYFAGDSQCYTCQTCEQRGLKTCGSSCIAQTECCGGCPNGQACINGTCGKSTLACENYIRSVCTNKCSINGDTFSSGVQTIVLVDKDIDLGTIKFNQATYAKLTSAAEYADTEACAGLSKPRVTGSLNIPAGSASAELHLNYLRMIDNSFVTQGNASFYFDHSEIESPTFTYVGADAFYGIPLQANFSQTSEVSGKFTASNGGALVFEIDPARTAITLEEISVTNSGAVVFMSTDMGFQLEGFGDIVRVGRIMFTVNEKAEFGGQAIMDVVGINAVFNQVIFQNYAQTVVRNAGGYAFTRVQFNDLIFDNSYSAPTYGQGRVKFDAPTGMTAFGNLILADVDFHGETDGKTELQRLTVNNDTTFYFFSYAQETSTFGSVPLSSGQYIVIDRPGDYTRNAFSPYIKQ